MGSSSRTQTAGQEWLYQSHDGAHAGSEFRILDFYSFFVADDFLELLVRLLGGQFTNTMLE